MHEHARAFIESVADAFPLQHPIYEFGYSPGVDSGVGSPAHGPSAGQGCLASDQSEPVRVDRLEDLGRLPFPDGAARTVLAINALEYVFEPRRAVDEMLRILAPGGMLVLCSQSCSQFPDGLNRYWQPTPRAIGRLLAGIEATVIGWQGADDAPHTLFGIASKPPVGGSFPASVNRFLNGYQRRLDRAAVDARWWQRLWHVVTRWTWEKVDEDDRPAGAQLFDPHHPAGRPERSLSPLARNLREARFVLHLPLQGQFQHHLLADCRPDDAKGTRLDLHE